MPNIFALCSAEQEQKQLSEAQRRVLSLLELCVNKASRLASIIRQVQQHELDSHIQFAES